MNTYTTKLDMQTGTISVYKVGVIGAQEITCPIDEWPALLEVITESGQAEYERAKAIMGNPLLDTRGIDRAMELYRHEFRSGLSDEILAMVEFYQNTLVMLKELESCLHMTANSIEAYDDGKFAGEYLNLLKWRDKIAAILEAHKHNMPAIVEGE